LYLPSGRAFVSGPDELPEDVRALLQEHIESYEQLELLLLLRRERYEEWTIAGLATRLHVREELIRAALERLKAAGLVATAGATPAAPRFAYRPASSGLDAAAGRLDREYEERPIRIIQLMSANAIDRVRTAALHTFADAFVLQKKDTDRG
jgi:predicted ArsR family transcriptional regulator